MKTCPQSIVNNQVLPLSQSYQMEAAILHCQPVYNTALFTMACCLLCSFITHNICSVQKLPGLHKLMGIYTEVLILGVIL